MKVEMYLNTLQPPAGAKKSPKRVGRGIGSGLGKTCGRGHKGQRARAGGYHKVGFEGGQMPLQRRLPKVGFFSRLSLERAELRLSDLNKLSETEVVDLARLKKEGLAPRQAEQVKLIATGKLTKPFIIRGLVLSKGARSAVEIAGGRIED